MLAGSRGIVQCARGRRSCPFSIVMALIGCGVVEKAAGVLLTNTHHIAINM